MPTINIGPCDCCGSSSSTTSSSSSSSSSTSSTSTDTTTTGTGTTGTTTTGTGTTGTTDTTTTSDDCCLFWDQVGESYVVDVDLSNHLSCECGGYGFDDLYAQGNGTFVGSVVLCEPLSGEGCDFLGLTLGLTIECPSVSSSGQWRLSWSLYGECSASGSINANSVFCNEDEGFEVIFGPIGGISSDDCCDDDCDGDGGSGSGTWTITFAEV